jgi:argininosuccinate lyase
VALALGALSGMVATATFDTERMNGAAASPTMAATDLAEWLVARGVPFREAHAAVGSIVRAALEPGAPPLVTLVAGDERFGTEAAALVAPGAAVARRTTPGGGGPGPVAVQLDRFRDRLAADRLRLPA